MDKIVLKNMKFFGYHGLQAEEQLHGQVFVISIEMKVDLRKPGKTDNIFDTVDYSKIFKIVKNITENLKFKLMEKLAETISEKIFSACNEVRELIININKPHAPIRGDFDWVGVEIRRKNTS